MQASKSYKPTGSKEIDSILKQAYKYVEESNSVKDKIQKEISKSNVKKRNLLDVFKIVNR